MSLPCHLILPLLGFALKSDPALIRFLTSSLCSLSPTMALQLGAGDGFNRDLGDHDGKLTFAEAVVQVNGQKLIGPERRPYWSQRLRSASMMTMCTRLLSHPKRGHQ